MRLMKLPAAMLAPVLLLSACASEPLGPTIPVMPAPGKPFDVFQEDQALCKQNARPRSRVARSRPTTARSAPQSSARCSGRDWARRSEADEEPRSVRAPVHWAARPLELAPRARGAVKPAAALRSYLCAVHVFPRQPGAGLSAAGLSATRRAAARIMRQDIRRLAIAELSRKYHDLERLMWAGGRFCH